MDVIRTIRVDGGPMPAGMLEAMLREEGVRAERAPDDREIERRGIDWSSDIQMTVSAIVATGGAVAIGAAVGRFRKRFPKATVEVEGNGPETAAVAEARPDDGGFLDG